MPISADLREQLLIAFRAELTEHIQNLTDGLLAIEQHRVAGDERRALLEDIFRAAHSLKGAARGIGINGVEQLAHALEDILVGLQRETLTPVPELFTAAYRTLDAIHITQAAHESGQENLPPEGQQALQALAPFRSSRPAGPTQEPEMPGSEPEPDFRDSEPRGPEPGLRPQDSGLRTSGDTVRISTAKLDALMTQVGELLVARIRADQRLAQLRQTQDIIAQSAKEWQAVRGAYRRVQRIAADAEAGTAHPARGTASGERRLEPLGRDAVQLMEYAGDNQQRLREVQVLLNTLTREQADDALRMALAIDALEQEIKRARMLPLGTITGGFGRMVRDLAQTAGKEAVLVVTGGEVELDKHVLEQIKDPLTHMLRNAVDHGIEPPERRVAAGKPRSGCITLSAEQSGKDVMLRVADDGGGLDLEAIRRAVARRGRHDAAALREDELAELIFAAGVSTSPMVTDLSGRGIGLDIVRRNVEALHGRITVDWAFGGGTSFTLVLPLVVTSAHGLLVRAEGQAFAIPLGSVERILRVVPGDIVALEGYDTIRYNGRPVTLVRLGTVLGLPPANGGKANGTAPLQVVILATAERRMAFVVDELLGEQELVMKTLGPQLQRVGGVAGATVMGNGDVVLTLNVADLVKLVLRGERRPVLASGPDSPAPVASRPRRHILIVDDSITTRTLEKNILEAAGYAITVATDGQEALDHIAAGEMPDLVISDLSMPRVDGFTLTKRLKTETRTAAVPVILVSSLASPADKARGLEAGADAYIVKSQFDQSNLLATIEQLL